MSNRPLITSSVALRVLATAVTFVSTIGMTAFAATHVQNTAAPLKPAAPASIVATQPTATPAPTATSRRTTTVTGRVPTTTAAPRTKTHSS